MTEQAKRYGIKVVTTQGEYLQTCRLGGGAREVALFYDIDDAYTAASIVWELERGSHVKDVLVVVCEGPCQ